MGRTYAGDDSDSFVHLVDEGWLDNEIPINFRISTGIMRAAKRGITSDYLEHHFGGLLNATGQFYMRVILDGSVIENKKYYATKSGTSNDLRDWNLMDIDTGVAIGSGQIGAEQIGSGGQVADAFSFQVPYELGGEAQQAQIEFETTDESTIFELRHLDLLAETEGEAIITHT